ncbi:MAG: hypothetical protein WAK95_08725 [Desulfobacterales bacterium]
MASLDEQILKAAKEIVVKFIETGRLSPSGFGETFKSVYRTIEKTVQGKKPPGGKPPAGMEPPKAAKQ